MCRTELSPARRADALRRSRRHRDPDNPRPVSAATKPERRRRFSRVSGAQQRPPLRKEPRRFEGHFPF